MTGRLYVLGEAFVSSEIRVSLEQFVSRTDPPDRRLVVVGADADDPLAAMLAETFGSSIDVETAPETHGIETTDRLPEDEPTVVLLEGDRIEATSPMSTVYDAVLGINSDLFVTGARGIEDVGLPAVFAGLEGHRFGLRGYPRAGKEKLLLIVVSRWIERLAWVRGRGTLRSAFQELSRIDDEVGTREAYETLAGTDLAVHLYGAGGSERLDRLGSVHRGTSPAYRRSWFVVFRPPTGETVEESDGEVPTGAAQVAIEDGPGVWEGFWTTDPETVQEIDDHIAGEL